MDLDGYSDTAAILTAAAIGFTCVVLWQSITSLVEWRASSEPFRCTLSTSTVVRSPDPAASPPNLLKLLASDTFACDAIVLDSVWFFDKHLDAASLQRSLQELLRLYPALAGRRAPGGIALNNAGVPFSVLERTGSARAVLNLPEEPQRGMFAECHGPKSVAAGRSPIMTVRLTHFEDGTSALGVATSHALLDGFSHCKLVQLWGIWHTTGCFPPGSPYTMDRAALSVSDSSVPDASVKSQGHVRGKASRVGPFLRLLFRQVGNQEQRVRLHLTAQELTELKASAVASTGDATLTTNEALSARLLQHLAPLVLDKATLPSDVSVVSTINMRGKGGLPRRFLGNLFMASYELPGVTTGKEMDDASALHIYKAMGDELRQADGEAAAASWRGQAALLEDNVAWLPASDPGLKMPQFLSNNQSSFVQAHVTFGNDIRCIGYRPWAAGDVVQIVPSIEPRACTGTDQRHALARQGSLLKSLVLEEDLARPLFDSLDTQGVGLLSKDQVAAWLRTDRESTDWSEVEVDALIATMDTNSDGYVSYSELSVALHAASLSGGVDIYANRLGSAISQQGRKHIMSAEFKAALLAR